MLTPFVVGFAAVLGVLIGSFLNVVIHRVPAGLSVVRPRSACPGCASPIRDRDNIPVLSWLLLGGKCRDCRAPISARYPIIEAATGALFAVTAWWFWPSGLTLVALYLVAVGVALFMIDLDHHRLPDALVLPSYPVVIGLLVVAGFLDGGWPVGRALWSALVWLLVFGIPWFATAGRGMGFGDVKLAPVLGLVLGWVGWGASLVGLLGGFMFGALVGVALLVTAKAGRRSRIPYGPFMLVGGFFGLLVGRDVFGMYLRLTGLA